MSANNNYGAPAAPLGCLNEHLDYFSQSIASKEPILAGDFDDIFCNDFDLVFDPILMSDAATVARPVILHHEPQPQHHVQQAQPMVHQPQHQPQHQPVPVNVQSRSFVPPPPAKKAKVVPASFAPPTPAPAPKPTVKAPIRKIAPAQVSPTSVTAVFESIPSPVVPKSSPRKRSYSVAQSSPKPAPAESTPPVDTSNMSFEEQEDLRRERNRHHAKRSRQRKRNYMSQLEDAVNEMRKENERLFDLLGMDSRRAKADMAQEEERKKTVATDKFIAGLKQPRNRVLDNTTLAFLRELWK